MYHFFTKQQTYLNFFIFSDSSDPKKWLELVASHLLRRLVYIDIGVGYQMLRVEFRNEQFACYSFLLRDEEKCTIISTKLTCEYVCMYITYVHVM